MTPIPFLNNKNQLTTFLGMKTTWSIGFNRADSVLGVYFLCKHKHYKKQFRRKFKIFYQKTILPSHAQLCFHKPRATLGIKLNCLRCHWQSVSVLQSNTWVIQKLFLFQICSIFSFWSAQFLFVWQFTNVAIQAHCLYLLRVHKKIHYWRLISTGAIS